MIIYLMPNDQDQLDTVLNLKTLPTDFLFLKIEPVCFRFLGERFNISDVVLKPVYLRV